MLRVGAIVPETEAEGPGRRFALWVQGCSLRCPGCCNPQLFDSAGGREIDVGAVAAMIDAVRPRIEGVTFLGGEPFEQAGPVAAIAAAARARGLSVMVFSGYTLEELREQVHLGVRGTGDLLAATDLLVDGRYDARLPESERLWAGSTNQRFHRLTDRYPPGVERPVADAPLRTVEVRLGGGRVLINGWPALR